MLRVVYDLNWGTRGQRKVLVTYVVERPRSPVDFVRKKFNLKVVNPSAIEMTEIKPDYIYEESHYH